MQTLNVIFNSLEGEYGPGAGGKGDDLSKFKKPAKVD